MARRGANIDSYHIVIKLRARICRASNVKLQQLRRFAVDRLKDRDVAPRYYEEFESELQGVQAQPLSLDERFKKLEETIQRVAKNNISYTRKEANKELFDEECAMVNEEKNATRERAIQIKTRGVKNAYKLARKKERRLFRKKARQLDEEVLIEIERHQSIQDSRKFYKRLNDVRRRYV
jgi:DNA segregation ATPase FtsK/SpoIIIE-like protein